MRCLFYTHFHIDFYVTNYYNKDKVIRMNKLWEVVQTAVSVIGCAIGYFIGDIDGLVISLIIFASVDYATGVISAMYKKKLSSKVGFKGIAKKLFMFIMVGIANVIDVNIVGQPALRTATIFFYLSNECLSIIENAVTIGLPIPEKFKQVLEQIRQKGE